jgi:hypothetical protein
MIARFNRLLKLTLGSGATALCSVKKSQPFKLTHYLKTTELHVIRLLDTQLTRPYTPSLARH